MKAVQAIKKFFERPDAFTVSEEGGRKLTIPELKELSSEDKRELGQLAAAELGETFEESKPLGEG